MTVAGQLELEQVGHRYGNVVVLAGVDLKIDGGEFLTLLGPSGCGKTTLLRIIAGFIQPAQGVVRLGGRDITWELPEKRPVNMVFQRPTLFPHLDVFNNVAFGLKVEGIGREQIEERVLQALTLVRLSGYERRKSHELSGGQMQRVALARALVKRPGVLLLDEPLSALDQRVRLEMEGELRRVHRETGATFVYVTHDQREALALSDRIVVMNEGRIEQAGSPKEVYSRPESVFAARFVGDSNVLAVELRHCDGKLAHVVLGGRELVVPCAAIRASGPAWLAVRPDMITVFPIANEPDAAALTGSVTDAAFRGNGFDYRVDVPGLAAAVKVTMSGSTEGLPVGARVALSWQPGACRLLGREPDEAPSK